MTDPGADRYHRFLQGDQGALCELITEYGDPLVRFAYRYLHDFGEAEDVMEDTFAVLVVKRKKFEERASLKAYLFAIARNKCVDILRARKRFAPLPEQLCAPDPHWDVVQNERERALQRGIAKLPAHYRDAIVLTYLEGFSVSETAKILRKSKKQIYNLLARAKRTLKAYLIREDIFDEND